MNRLHKLQECCVSRLQTWLVTTKTKQAKHEVRFPVIFEVDEGKLTASPNIVALFGDAVCIFPFAARID